MAEEQKQKNTEEKITVTAPAEEETVIVRKRIGEDWVPLIRIGVTVFVTFVCCVLFFFFILRFKGLTEFIGKFLNASESIIMGLVLAFILNPVMKFLERIACRLLKKRMGETPKAKRFYRGLGIAGTVIFLLAMLTLFFIAVIPAVYKSIANLVNLVPTYVDNVVDLIDSGKYSDNAIAVALANGLDTLNTYTENWVQNTLLPQMQTYIQQITTGVINIVSSLLNFIVGIFVMCYAMAIQRRLSGQVKKVIYAVSSPRIGNYVIEFIRKCSEVFGGFITGKLIDSLIIGIIAYIGCSILRIPDTVLISVIIGVTNIIPFFGPFIGAIPSLLIVVIQSPWHALYLLIFIIVLQQTDGNFIGPKILGTSTGLSSFWVMVAILVGGGMFGVIGMILGVPTVGMLYYIVQRLVNHALRTKNLPDDSLLYAALDKINLKDNTMIMKDPAKKKKKKK